MRSIVAASTVLAALLSGCATGGSYPPAPTRVDVPDLRYQIGPLDTLSVVVWRNPELSATVTVRPDGYVSTPLVPEVKATGRTPSELASDV